jgi:diaminopimelate epimerase
MIPFVKMHGIGNDFVMIDAVRNPLDAGRIADLARAMCDRRFGVGADGLILIANGRETLAMRMWNPDGSESEMCGNGVRCFARFARTEGLVDADSMVVETGAGLLRLDLLPDGRVSVDMGYARFRRGEIGMTGEADQEFVDQPVESAGFQGPATAVSMGNPHLILFVPNVDAVDLSSIGPSLERHPSFPHRVNVHFAQVLARDRLRQRTWERGAGITLACGTGACAVLAAARRTGRADDRAYVELPGGELEIEASPDNRIKMTGPAEEVYRGLWPG